MRYFENLTLTGLNSKYTRWYHSIFIAVLFLLVHGYRFNTGDQEEHLPQVYKMMDASLYAHDYFMSHVDESFNVRFYFKWLVYLVSQILSVEVTCFLLTFICLTVTSWSVMKITEFFSKGK